MQEWGRHLQWSKDGYSILKQCRCHKQYMSTYLYIWFIHVQTDLAIIKGSTRGFESVVVIIEYNQTFSYHLRRLNINQWHQTKQTNTKDCQLNTLKVLFWNKIPKHLPKKVPNLWKTRNTRRFLRKLGKTRSTFKILGKTRNAGKPGIMK